LADAAPPAGRPRTIALDGPAASGKTTVGRRLAERLGSLCFDTGLLYRAATVLALRESLSPEDEGALVDLVGCFPISVVPDAASRIGCRVMAGEADLTEMLHTPAVDANVSAVSRHGQLRAALLEAQRAVAAGTPVVMLGRDIGTVVLPDADLKLYLDASAEARARRRFRERLARGEPAVYTEVHAATRARDARDAGRAVAPLAAAPDAVVVNTDRCTIDDVVEHLLRLADRWPDPLTTEGGSAPCVPAMADGGG
jgi:cytidylate kinase